MKIAIIGAGASGLLSAMLLSKNHDVIVFERLDRPGRKILASGNGKANISNLNMNEKYYNNQKFVKDIYDVVKPQMVWNLFKSLKLLTTTDEEGRIYPYSLSSQTVLDVILKNCNNVKFVYNYNVNKLNYNNGWIINDYDCLFDHVIVSSGSIAGIIAKKQAGIYDYLSFVNMTKLQPSLCGFKVSNNIKDLSGLRCKVNAKLLKNGKVVYSENGEVIFKDEGISGIVIMNLESIYVNDSNKDSYEVELDLLPEINISDLSEYTLDGIVNKKLVSYLKLNNYNDALKKLKSFKLQIKGTYEFSDAQVVCGGVNLNEVNSRLEYIKNNTLHFGGEVLDIDGRCGGYNLHFAFSCAILHKLVIDNEI